MNAEEYNGWTNRETWATALHINNDQWLQETAEEYAIGAQASHDEDSTCTVLGCLAETFECWITEDLLTLENIAGNQGLFNMLTDIGSLYRVNWREIAESFLDVVKAGE